MKSASDRPVFWPLKVNAPLVGRLLRVSILVWIQLHAERDLVVAAHQIDVVGQLEADSS